jgi:RNA polymerase sigma factor (sigma-70 family)
MNNDFDRAIIKRLKGDDFLALVPLSKKYRTIIHQRILLVIKDVNFVEDIAAETFNKVWLSRQTLDINKSFRGFLLTIARNLAINYALKDNKRKEAESVYLYAGDTYTPDPVKGKDILARIHASIATITPRSCRDAFAMYYLQQKKSQEIASELGLKEQVVRNLLTDGRKIVREQLKDLLEL